MTNSRDDKPRKMVRCPHCEKHTEVREDRLQAHLRKVHPHSGVLAGSSSRAIPSASARRGTGSSGAGDRASVTKAATLDYLYGRRKELEKTILQERGPAREAAKEKRALLEKQLGIVLSGSNWRTKLDPALARAVIGGATWPPRAAEQEVPQPRPEKRRKNTVVPTEERPRRSYQDECSRMDFGELRAFIDEALDRYCVGRPMQEGPRSKKQFLALLQMLRGKVHKPSVPSTLPDPGPPPQVPGFAPSERLAVLRAERGRLAADLVAAESNPEATKRSIRKLRRKLELARREIEPLEAAERRQHAEHTAALLRPYEEARAAYRASLREREAATKKRPTRVTRRKKIVERVERDIQHAFAPGGRQVTHRLPWKLLPPGELSIERLRRHYEDVQHRNPDIRYEPQRLEKAFSLRPKECYVGTDEFDGYVVFTFPHTERVLLECPVYGNAVYVISRDWKRLIRLSKRDLLDARPAEVTKIVHKGEWFSKIKLMLGIRR